MCYCAKETKSTSVLILPHRSGTLGDSEDGRSRREGGSAGELICFHLSSTFGSHSSTQCPLSPDSLWSSSILSCLSLTLLSLLPCPAVISFLFFTSTLHLTHLSSLPSPHTLTHAHTVLCPGYITMKKLTSHHLIQQVLSPTRSSAISNSPSHSTLQQQ